MAPLNKMAPFFVWFTGWSGSGKSTLARLLTVEIGGQLIDGDDVRKQHPPWYPDPFSKEARDSNVLVASQLALEALSVGDNAIVAMISPYEATRAIALSTLGVNSRGLIVWTHASLEALVDRDPKGLYEKAIFGKIKHFTGISDPYEPPSEAEGPIISLPTDVLCPRCCINLILRRLRKMGHIPT